MYGMPRLMQQIPAFVERRKNGSLRWIVNNILFDHHRRKISISVAASLMRCYGVPCEDALRLLAGRKPS